MRVSTSQVQLRGGKLQFRDQDYDINSHYKPFETTYGKDFRGLSLKMVSEPDQSPIKNNKAGEIGSNSKLITND